MNEEWKPVRVGGMDWRYWVSNMGRVRNRHGRILRPQRRGQRKGNYHCVTLCDDGLQLRIDVHRLVALHFVANPEGKPEVNHMNLDHYDNRAENLEWCTRGENERHKYFMLAHLEIEEVAV